MEIKNEIQHKMLVDKVVAQSYSLLSTFYYLIILILLSITIGSCYSIESDCEIPIDPGTLPEDCFWELIPGSPTDIYRMACDANGNLWATTYNGDVHLYNGNSWQKRGSVGRVVHAIAVAPNGNIYIVGELSLYISTNGGTSWNTIFNINKKIEKDELAEIVISHSGEVYFAIPNNIYVPDGNSWRRIDANWLYMTVSCPIALAPNGTLYTVEKVSSYAYYIIRSTDAGNSWLRSTTFFNETDATFTLNRLTVVDNNTMFAAAGLNGILKSTDGGQSWAQCDSTIFERAIRAWDIIYNPITGMLFADIDHYDRWFCNAVISTDLGKTWDVRNDDFGRELGLGPYCSTFNPITGDTYLRVVSNSYAPYWEDWVGRVYRHVQQHP